MYLLIGDMHVKRDNIVESERIIDWIVSLCQQNQYIPVFMGDQYDKHGIIQVEVLDFWVRSFAKFAAAGYGGPTYALSGNHDMNGDGSYSAMVAHSPVIITINDHGVSLGSIGMMPFMRSNDAFVAEATRLYNAGRRTILCHQEFDGAVYENGFYAPGGVKLDSFPSDLKFVSGHIHKRQTFGNVLYIGTPRQLSAGEIGDENKGLALFDPAIGIQFIPTPNEVAEKFQVVEVTPENSKVTIPTSDKILVKITGPVDFCRKFAKKLPDGVRIKTEATDIVPVVSTVKESDGIGVAFSKYFKKYCKENNLPLEDARAIATKIFNKCPYLRG